LPNGRPGPIEVLSNINIVITFGTTYIVFVRSSVNEYYYGICMPGGVGDPNQPKSKTIRGQFRGGTTFNLPCSQFAAQQDLTDPPIDKISDEHFGSYAILNNGTAGTLTLDNNGVTGTIQLENDKLNNATSLLPIEHISLLNYSYKYNGWYLTFYRQSTNQNFYGIYSYGSGSTQVAGSYFSDLPTPWPFAGAKRKVLNEATVPFDRTDGCFQNAYAGSQIFYNTDPITGNVTMAAAPLPNTNPAGIEILKNIYWASHMKNGFYYLFFNRTLGVTGWQYFYGLYDDTRNSTHGHFNDFRDKGNPWPYYALGNI